MLALGLGILFLGFLVFGILLDMPRTTAVLSIAACLVLVVNAVPTPAAYWVGGSFGWVFCVFANIALTAFWSKRYDWDEDTAPVWFLSCVVVAPIYLTLGLLIYAAVLVWDNVSSTTIRY